jgi:hypothetical protein
MTLVRSHRIVVTLVWLAGSLAAGAAHGHGVGRPPVDTRGATDAARSASQGALSAAQSGLSGARRDASAGSNRAGGTAGGSNSGGIDQAALLKQAAALDAEISAVNSEILGHAAEILSLDAKARASQEKVNGVQAEVVTLQREVDEIRNDISGLRRLKRGEHLDDPGTLPFSEWEHYDNQQKLAEQKLFERLDRRAEAEARLRQAEAEHQGVKRQAEADKHVVIGQLVAAKARRDNLTKQRGQLPASEQGTWDILKNVVVSLGVSLTGGN